MARLPHGQHVTTGDAQEASARIAELSADVPLAFVMVQPAELHAFDFMFPGLQADPDNLLPEDPSTVSKLVNLGRTMHDRGRAAPDDPGDGNIPAAYTYFSQFVDHDLTLEALSASLPQLLDPNLTPMPIPQIKSTLKNARTATLDLDNLYSAPAPRDPAAPDKMALGRVS